MILVLNSGSQTTKWKLFNSDFKVVEENGDLEKFKIKNYKISKIGHRVVHGGSKFIKPVKITEEVLNELEGLNSLAPLHNPYNMAGIRKCREFFPNVPQFAVFDTEFFSHLPEKAKTYALPEEVMREFGFSRYGFHGISHEFVSKQFKASKIISCHLGGGCSIAAIKNGKAVDTSMGFTPMEGLVMMSRAGNIDAGIVLKIAEKYGIERAGEILNKESGMKGICGESEMLKILQKKDALSKLAFDVFVYSVQKYIGSYYAILGGCDVLIFTGAIGAGLAKTRNAISRLKILANTKIVALKTDEELAIANKIFKL